MLELEELWSVVGHTGRVRWLWMALCRHTRQVVADGLGARREASCRRRWERIPEADRRSLCDTDFWPCYQAGIPAAQHQAVGKESGQTNHVERWTGTLRQRRGRFVRKSRSFSTCEHRHEACLRLFLHRDHREHASTPTINLR